MDSTTPVPVTGTKYTRSNVVTVTNPYGGVPTITFGRETIVLLDDNTHITMENLGAISESLINPTEPFNLIHPADGVTKIGSATYQEVYLMLYGLYLHVSNKTAARAVGNILAGSFIVGQVYTIVTVGDTDFTLVGSANNNVGTTFTATGAGIGSGTVLLA
jgi:hypothetical protein